jgi:hypothetical protein
LLSCSATKPRKRTSPTWRVTDCAENAALINPNCVHKEVKSKIKSGESCLLECCVKKTYNFAHSFTWVCNFSSVSYGGGAIKGDNRVFWISGPYDGEAT